MKTKAMVVLVKEYHDKKQIGKEVLVQLFVNENSSSVLRNTF